MRHTWLLMQTQNEELLHMDAVGGAEGYGMLIFVPQLWSSFSNFLCCSISQFLPGLWCTYSFTSNSLSTCHRTHLNKECIKYLARYIVVFRRKNNHAVGNHLVFSSGVTLGAVSHESSISHQPLISKNVGGFSSQPPLSYDPFTPC